MVGIAVVVWEAPCSNLRPDVLYLKNYLLLLLFPSGE